MFSNIVTTHRAWSHRWTQTLKELGEQRIQLMGDCLLSSAFLCYVGAFTWDFRNQLVYTDWQADLREREVPMSQPFKLEAVLTDDVEISKYVMGREHCLCLGGGIIKRSDFFLLKSCI